VALLLAPFFRFFLLDLGSVTRQLFNHKREFGCRYLKASRVEALLNCWSTLLCFALEKEYSNSTRGHSRIGAERTKLQKALDNHHGETKILKSFSKFAVGTVLEKSSKTQKHIHL
jgi:hypothetical protein